MIVPSLLESDPPFEVMLTNLGDAIFPIGFPLLLILKILEQKIENDRVRFGDFLLFSSIPKPKDLVKNISTSTLLKPLAKFRGIILSPGDGFFLK